MSLCRLCAPQNLVGDQIFRIRANNETEEYAHLEGPGHFGHQNDSFSQETGPPRFGCRWVSVRVLNAHRRSGIVWDRLRVRAPGQILPGAGGVFVSRTTFPQLRMKSRFPWCSCEGGKLHQ